MHAGPALPPCPRAVPRCQMLKLPPAADTSITTKYEQATTAWLVALLRTLPFGAASHTRPGFKSPHDQSHGPVACRRCRRPCTALAALPVVHVSHALSRRPGDTSRASDGPSTPRQANQLPSDSLSREAPAAMRSSSQAFQMRTLLSSGPFSPLASAWPTSPSLRPWAGRPTPGARRRSS